MEGNQTNFRVSDFGIVAAKVDDRLKVNSITTAVVVISVNVVILS